MREVIVDGQRYVPDMPRLAPDGLTFGEYMLAARRRTGDSLEKAAAGIGCAKSYLWEIEQKNREISLDLAIRIADYYRLDINDMAACFRQKQEDKPCL